MKKPATKKLTLSTERVRVLGAAQLLGVQGGSIIANNPPPTEYGHHSDPMSGKPSCNAN